MEPIETTAKSETNQTMVEDISGESGIIRHLERRLRIKIPIVKKLKRAITGYEQEEEHVIGLSFYGVDLERIPPEIFRLSHLKKLYLRKNNLTCIDKSVGFMNSIEELDISSNKIKEIPPSISLLENLRILKLRSNAIRTIPDSIEKLNLLKIIDLSNNQLTELPPFLSDNPDLEVYAKGNLLLGSLGGENTTKKKKMSMEKQTSLDDFFQI